MILHPRPLARPLSVRDSWFSLQDSKLLGNISSLYKIYWNNAKQGGSLGKYKSDVRLDYNSCSPIVKCGGHLLHPTKCRHLSESEIKRLGSFPDSFLFNNIRKTKKVIGNSVPPLIYASNCRKYSQYSI